MKKTAKIVFHLAIAGVLSVISYIGLKKGLEKVEKQIKEKEENSK